VGKELIGKDRHGYGRAEVMMEFVNMTFDLNRNKTTPSYQFPLLIAFSRFPAAGISMPCSRLFLTGGPLVGF